MPQAERTASFASNNIFKHRTCFHSHLLDVYQDIIDSVTDDTNDFQTSCLNTSKSISMIQHMNISPLIECYDGKTY
jgi:hypothetical protein